MAWVLFLLVCALPTTLNQFWNKAAFPKAQEKQENYSKPTDNKVGGEIKTIGAPSNNHNNSERDKNREKGTDWTLNFILICTAGVFVWQGWYLRKSVNDGRISRLDVIVEGDGWLREIDTESQKIRFEVTATIRNLSPNPCIIDAIYGDIYIHPERFKQPIIYNERLSVTQAVYPGKSLVYRVTSFHEFDRRTVEEVKVRLEDSFLTFGSLPIASLCFHGVIHYRTLFNESFRTRYFARIAWEGDGLPHYQYEHDEFNGVEKTWPTLYMWFIGFMYKRKLGVTVMRFIYRTVGFRTPKAPFTPPQFEGSIFP